MALATRRIPSRAVLCALLAVTALHAGCALVPPGSRLEPAEQAALDLLRGGDARGAFEAYRTLAAKAPPERAARLHAEASVSARQAGLLTEALVERQESARLAPDDRWHRYAAAMIRLASGDPQGALVELGEPASAREWLTRGLAERRLGRAEDAIRSFEQAKTLDRSLAFAEQERGEALASMDRLPESASAYTAALTSDPSLTHLQPRLAALETRLGRNAKAYERYRRLLLVDAGHPVAKAERSRLAAAEPALAAGESQRGAERRRDWDALSPARVSPLPPTPLSPIAVGLAIDITGFRLKCGSACAITAEGIPYGEIPPLAGITGRMEGGALHLTWSGGGVSSSGPVRLVPTDPAATLAIFNLHFEKGFYWSDEEDRSYRGTMIVRPARNTLSLINEVPLEDFLLGLVPAEMPDEWPAEALKSQAVAARTETLKKLKRHSSKGFDVCASQHCAVYRGTTGEAASTTKAVMDTSGEVLLAPGGGWLDTVYSANCGGWGSTPGGVWGGAEDDSANAACDMTGETARDWTAVPRDPDLRERFLVERPLAWCNHAAYRASFRWVRAYTEDELAGLVLRRFKLAGLKDVRIGTMTAEGWATSIELVGEKETKTVKRDAIRAAAGTIRSNMMMVDHLPPAAGAPGLYIFTGAGWGHGTGLCQDGACGMAKAGLDYRKILAHYFPQARFRKLY